MPVGTPPPPPFPPEVVTIEVDFDGTLVWNGRYSKPGGARAAVRAARSMAVQRRCIASQKLAKYEHVALVLASAQRLSASRSLD